ncbi:transcription antitermination factor NusB [Bacteroidales bacterium OttesenSCG-928-I14]|nr:transcription antitermination factor NusB [Bacteroidales bacterium OttesenSCG-928-I14]
MINRVIIRIKVLQIVYAFYQKDGSSLKSAENELMRSIGHSYDLYFYLLFLMVSLTDTEQKRLDAQKHKYLPTEKELNPDTRLIENKFIEQLQSNQTLESFITKHGNIWDNDDNSFLRSMLTKILESDLYQDYLKSENNYNSDREFWHKVFKHIIIKDDELREIANDNSIYIDDDLELIGTFVLKTINRFDPAKGDEQELLPMFKDDEDREFAIQLLHRTLLEKEENSELINQQIKNWDIDRIAVMDLYIMQIALAEIKNFSNIPIQVSLNEYIDLARYYSTPQSARFINGILDAIVNELKGQGKLFKA